MRFLRLKEVLAISGMSRAALYRAIAREEFPRQLTLTPNGRAVAWDEAAVLGWREARIAAARHSDAR
jgi:prophage regulatory protein